MTSPLQKITALFMAFLVLFHVGCSAVPLKTTPSPSQDLDAGTFVPVDVTLQGLPGDTGLPDAGDGSPGSEVSLVMAPGPNGEAIVPLTRGAVAPFNGVLFNGPAVARVSVEFRAQQQRCMIEREHDVALVVARYNADIDSMRLALSIQQKTDQILLNGRDADIARLNRVIDQHQRQANGPRIGEGLIWAGGGLLVGAIVVGGIAFAVQSRP